MVGGVDSTGQTWPQSCFGDEVTVWANSVNTWTATPEGNGIYGYVNGTSQAAAAVSGLAAYFLSDPALASRLRVPGEVAMRVKRMISATAVTRRLAGASQPVIACNGVRLSAGDIYDRDLVFDLLLNGVLPTAG